MQERGPIWLDRFNGLRVCGVNSLSALIGYEDRGKKAKAEIKERLRKLKYSSPFCPLEVNFQPLTSP